MKKFLTILLLLATMFPFAAKADQLTVNDGTTTNRYIPIYGYYADMTSYAEVQFIIPKEGLTSMTNTVISGLTFYANYNQNFGNAKWNVYIEETSYTTLSSAISHAGSTPAYSGNMAIASNRLVITFDNQYSYGGENLLISFTKTQSGTCSSSSSNSFYGVTASNGASGYVQSGSTFYKQAFLPKVTFDYYVPSLEVSLTDLGTRPNGAWMEPVTVEVGGGVYGVTGMDMDNDYFTFDGPATPFTTPATFAVTTGDAAATGLVEGTLTFMYNDSKTVKQFNMTATAYDPVGGDVVETATVVSNPVGYTNTPAGIYHNYNLPGEASDGADAVYKLTFDSDVMLDANVGAAAGGKVALYAEDFNGEDGPMAHNTFSMNKPIQGDTFTESFESGSIPAGWTTIDADGDGHNWTPASVLMQGYVTPFHSGADCIVSESYSNSVGPLYPDNYLVTPKVAIANGSTFSFWACAQDPSYSAEHYGVAISTTTATAGAFTTIAEWTMTAKEAAGAGAYMSKNGKGTREGSWYQKSVDLSAYAGQQIYIAIRHFNCSDWFYLDVDDAELSTGSKGVAGTRESTTLFSCDFENFKNNHEGWVSIDADGDGHDWLTGTEFYWNQGAGVGGSHAIVSESYLNDGYVSLDADNYILTPVLNLPAGSAITLSWEAMSSYRDTYDVLVAPNGSTEISSFVSVFSETPASSMYVSHEIDLGDYAGTTVRVVFRHHKYNGYVLAIDNLSITAEGGDPEPGDGIFVPAGTYYLVAQATESFTTHINATAAPAPEQAVLINPTDGMTNVEAPVAASWTLGNYTKEMQVLVGSQYPPQDVLIDWTSNLTSSATINDLLPNTTYFIQVNARNGSGTTMGEVVGFTTSFEKPVITVATTYLYPGDAAFLSWEMDRSFRGYNVYADGVRVNEEIIVEDEYAVEGLTYGPHTLNVTAVYDEGESAYSNNINVNMTGYGHVAGTVYEQDGTTPIAGAAVKFIGTDAFGFDQTFTFTSANDGTFTGDIYEGSYVPQAELEGYQVTPVSGINIAYDQTIDGIIFNMYEEYKPVGQVNSEITADNKANVWWDWAPATVIEDFEHDGEMPEGWNQVGSYGWEVTTNAPYEGTYCIKSSNAGLASSTGAIEVTVEVPYDAKMSFYVKPSSESNYDKFYFYIDGAEKFNTSGAGSWTKKEFNVSAGTHTYKWAYTKDSSVNSNDDCIYVDYVTLFEKVQPEPPFAGGWIQYDDNTYASSVGTGSAGSNVYWAVCWPNASAYNGMQMTKAALYDAYAAAYTVNIYEGGDSAPQTLIGTTTVNGTGSSTIVEGTFSTPVTIDGTKSLWIVGVCSTLEYPMAGCNYVGDPNSDLLSLDGATWEHAADYSLSYSWMLRGYLTNAKGEEFVLDGAERAPQNIVRPELTFDYGTPSTGTFMAKVAETPVYVGAPATTSNNTRSFASYNVYLKNVLADEYSKITSTTDTTYVHAQWSTLPAGVYQYGVSATYAGNRGNRDEVTFSFEGGLEGWNVLDVNAGQGTWVHSDNNLQGQDYTAQAHTGEGFALCYSFVDYVGPVNTDSYMYTPQKYNIVDGSTFSFWADNANDSYPENFSVCIATADNPQASDFTQIWSGGAKGGNAEKAAVRHNGDRFDNWRHHTIDLSAYAGQQVYIAFHDVNYDAYEIWIDDVTITYGGAPVPPTPTGDGESEIVWADPMDKDMVATVDVSAVTNNGQSAAGTLVKFENMVENLSYEAILDETGFVSFGDFRKGYYTMSVELPGYAANMGGEVEIFEDKTYNVTLTEVIAPAEGLFASATGWVMWDNNGGDIPTPPQGDTEFTEGFEGGLNGWNVLNVNAAGGTWLHSDDNLQGQIYTAQAHTGTGFALCYSYVDYVGSFDTDSYLYTPQKYDIVNGSTLNFWADNANDLYPENFSVCVATADNPQDADFTEIWSGGAKGGNAEKAAVRHNGNRFDNWRHHTIDLSAYAGQQVYIAFHDVNYDAYEIWIDDVELTAGSKGNRAAQYSIVMLDGVIAGQATGNWFQLDTDNLVEGQEYEVSVASVYASGMSEWRTTAFTYYSCDNFKPGVKNLAGEVQGMNDVKLTWTLPGGGGEGDEFSFAFDNDLEGWTNIDGDGDGHVFYHSNEAGNHGTMAVTSHSGAGHVMGESYCNATWAALTPNDFFVTPQQYNIGASSMLSFWACAQDENYAAEHFGVAISTTGNTSASDFTTIAEWTLTAKEGAKGPRATDGSREGAWYEYTCDLSDYAGQAAWIAIRHFNCSDQFLMCLDDIAMNNADGKKGNNREMWDYVASFTGTSAGQQAVATDGEFIYTASWQATPTGGYTFYKYDLEGSFVEGFDISGATGIRDLTFDGEYFYGSSGASQLFILDLANKTKIGQINCSGATSRHCTYDPVRDGFWVGNWSDLALYDRSGAMIQNGPSPSSAYGSGYFQEEDGTEHLYLFCQPNSDALVYDYNITTGQLTGPVMDFSQTPGFNAGISGGSFIGQYGDKICWFGNAQQDPNLIGIYELAEGQPIIEGDFLGAMIFRDGELITPEPLMAQQMVDENVPNGEHEYMARLAFGNPELGVLDTMWYAMSCPVFATVNIDVECTPVEELEATAEYNADGTYGVNLEWICTGTGIQGYKVYRDNSYIGMTTTMSYYDERTNNPGSYTYGVVAVYDYCESDMVTVNITITDVEENDIVEGIYPNPTTGKLYIKAAAMQQITVANTLGQVMMNETVGGNETMIDMSAFEAGIYMVTVRTESGSTVKRISVVK